MIARQAGDWPGHGEGHPGQTFAMHSKKARGRQINFRDPARAIEADVPGWREIIQFGVSLDELFASKFACKRSRWFPISRCPVAVTGVAPVPDPVF